jgi:poly-gamma-glutamate synthesis protein (capsule biosynthesis protein)
MRLVFGGDVMLGRLVDEWFLARGRSPFTTLAPILRAADLCAVNLECAITDRNTWYSGPRKAFYFRARATAASVLADAGIDVVSLANNHALDAGEAGLIDTLSLLDAHGIAHAGAGANLDAASRPAVLSRRGRLIALLSYCDHQADFAAGPDRPGIRYLDLDRPDATATIVADIRRARAAAEWVMVAFHWQENWAPVVAPAYRALGRACLEAGALVVWGHSPHHFQGVEFVGPGVILYATGGLVDDYAVDPDYRNDLQLLFELDAGPTGITRVAALPIAIMQGEAMPAEGEDHAWITRTFAGHCRAVGSAVHAEGDRLVVTTSKLS